MKWHRVNALTVWPVAIQLAGNLFATPQQINRIRLLQVQSLETGARSADLSIENLLCVKLEDDETILLELVQSDGEVPVLGGRFLQLSISPEGIVALAASTFGRIVTDPPTGYT